MASADLRAALNVKHLREWIGRTDVGVDIVTPRLVAGLRATLDQQIRRTPGNGDARAAWPRIGAWRPPPSRCPKPDKTVTPSAAASCRPSRCRAACGPAVN